LNSGGANAMNNATMNGAQSAPEAAAASGGTLNAHQGPANPPAQGAHPGAANTHPKGDEKSAQHGKRAMWVALALGGLVIGGLLVDSLRSGINTDTKAKPEEPQAVSPGRDPFDDFEARQRAELARLEAERRKRLVANQTEAVAQAASANALSPEEELRQAFRLEELKRGLAAVRSTSMITSGSPAGATVRTAGLDSRGGGDTGGKAEATLSKLRQAIDRARGGGGGAGAGGGGGITEGLSNVGASFARELQGAQASSAIVGQSASARRAGGERQARDGEYLLPVGSVLSGVLDMEINSDWEGRWRALLIRDVYDTTQQVILLPKGTRILGTTVRAKPVNEAINERMALAANWLVLPNGARIDLSRSGTLDASGVGAIEGDVNRHFLAQIGGVVAYGVIGGVGAAKAAASVGNAGGELAALSLGRSAGAEIASGLVGIGQRVAARYLNLVPTITIKPGTPMTIFLDDEMYLNAWAPVDDVMPGAPSALPMRSASR
jgi:Bacterial conjugation TrbI-like protein